MTFWAQRCGYSVERVDPEDERERLQREVLAMGRELNAKLAMLNKRSG